LNLIEHDQRAVSGALLIKLAEIFHLDLAAFSGSEERRLEIGLREAFSDPLLGVDAVSEAEVSALADASPNAARAVLALYRAWRVAREDAGGIALPSGRRVLLPNEEARDFFDDRANHFPSLEEAANEIADSCAAAPAEMNHAIAERLRHTHGLAVIVQPLDGVLRRFDPETRRLCSRRDAAARESRVPHGVPARSLRGARRGRNSVARCRAILSGSRDADPVRTSQLRRRRCPDAIHGIPRGSKGSAPRHGGVGGALWGFL